jgi:hypothetical protein
MLYMRPLLLQDKYSQMYKADFHSMRLVSKGEGELRIQFRVGGSAFRRE